MDCGRLSDSGISGEVMTKTPRRSRDRGRSGINPKMADIEGSPIDEKRWGVRGPCRALRMVQKRGCHAV